ncbi:hypothetical protein BHE74_00024438 [Ensete ventricosum]|nr:hypothetical protein BHE74_00024438 [Ensete ventricosum]
MGPARVFSWVPCERGGPVVLKTPRHQNDAGGRSVPLLVGGRGDGLLCDPLDRGLPHIVGELYILLQRK